MTIKIVTDSTCDLPAALLARYGITVTPVYINLDGQSYLDGVELSREAFYERLPGLKSPATTSAPGPSAFVNAYERLVAEGATGILSIHVSPIFSNILNAARLGAEAFTALPVQVYDARQLSLGTGFTVLKAAQAAAEGMSAPEIIALLDDQVKRTYVVAALDTVEYLRRSGRMSSFQFSVASILQIKPVLRMHDGAATSEKVRTSKRAHRRLIEMVAELGPLEQLALVHTHATAAAAALWEDAQGVISDSAAPLSVDVTPVLGAHLGPGAVGFVCVARAASQ